MSEKINLSNQEDNIKEENDFLKMKIMLEHGGKFYDGSSSEEIPPEIENEFLNNILEFEKQAEHRKTIRLFDRIGRPQRFKPVSEITDDQIDEEYNTLLEHLEVHGIGFSVCSPNIKTRELYRFITEELFEYEMDDIRVPGWMTNFIYDEFYPDPYYDNARDAEDCIGLVLRKEPTRFMGHCRSQNLQLNEHHSLSESECIDKVNRFKLAYDDLEVNEIKVLECTVDEHESFVSGNYHLTAISGNEEFQLTGDWRIKLELDEDFGYWFITDIQIEGIRF